MGEGRMDGEYLREKKIKEGDGKEGNKKLKENERKIGYEDDIERR